MSRTIKIAIALLSLPLLLTPMNLARAELTLTDQSGGGGLIAFAGYKNTEEDLFDTTEDIYIVKPDGTDLQRRTDLGPDQKAIFPQWSPDGERIAFIVSDKDCHSQHKCHEIWVMDKDGDNRIRLHVPREDYSEYINTAYGLRWHPDGTKIYGMLQVPSRTNGWVEATAESPPIDQPLTPVRNDGLESWVFRFDFDRSVADYTSVVGIDTSSEQLFKATIHVNGEAITDTVPVLDVAYPDLGEFQSGTDHLVFQMNYGAATTIETVRVSDPENTRHEVIRTSSSQMVREPTWSPDGSLIAYRRQISSQQHQVYIIPWDLSSPPINLTGPLGFSAAVQPDWSPVLNQPPSVEAGETYPGDEGSPIPLSEANATDQDTDTLTYSWSVDNPSLCSFDDPTEPNPNLACDDNGNYIATLVVSDGVNDPVSDDATVNVSNVAPTIETITVPLDPVNFNDQTMYTVDVTFSDPAGVNDEPYTCDFDLDYDGMTFNSDATVSGVTSNFCSTPLNYAETGVYTVKAAATDKDNGTGWATATQFIVIYDPEGGFVTGGGWIWSDPGWCHLDEGCAGAEGKANFGFVSKYKKGANVPSGNTEFNFSAGGLNFHSDTYDWLVVTGGNYARFKGVGTINGEGEHKFHIWAGDGDPDTFRIRIWTEDETNGVETVVYDNGMDQAIGGGNIKIHDN